MKLERTAQPDLRQHRHGKNLATYAPDDGLHHL
jgi:hypothetical protein